jgi:hypothetical protein
VFGESQDSCAISPSRAQRRAATSGSEQVNLQRLLASSPPHYRMVELIPQSTFGPRAGHGILSSRTTPPVRRDVAAGAAAPSGRLAWRITTCCWSVGPSSSLTTSSGISSRPGLLLSEAQCCTRRKSVSPAIASASRPAGTSSRSSPCAVPQVDGRAQRDRLPVEDVVRPVRLSVGAGFGHRTPQHPKTRSLAQDEPAVLGIDSVPSPKPPGKTWGIRGVSSCWSGQKLARDAGSSRRRS